MALIPEFRLSKIPSSNKMNPGVLLSYELRVRGISIYQASMITCVPIETLSGIIEHMDSIYGLEKNLAALDILTAEQWTRLQHEWNNGTGTI